jgi:hypothetical protein
MRAVKRKSCGGDDFLLVIVALSSVSVVVAIFARSFVEQKLAPRAWRPHYMLRHSHKTKFQNAMEPEAMTDETYR